MSLASKLSFGSVLLLWASLAAGQNTLGELLDAGARRLSAEEFRRDLVGRSLSGAMPVSPEFEVVYTGDGQVRGVGIISTGGNVHGAPGTSREIEGSWTMGDSETICISMRVGFVTFSKRCQFWFKLGNEYFLSDSDSDRSMRVFRRTVKK